MAGRGRRSGASSSKLSKAGRSVNRGQQQRNSGTSSASSRTSSRSGNNRDQSQDRGRQGGNFCSECGAPRQGGRDGYGAYGEGEWGQRGGTGRYEGTYSRSEPSHRRDDDGRSRHHSNRPE